MRVAFVLRSVEVQPLFRDWCKSSACLPTPPPLIKPNQPPTPAALGLECAPGASESASCSPPAKMCQQKQAPKPSLPSAAPSRQLCSCCCHCLCAGGSPLLLPSGRRALNFPMMCPGVAMSSGPVSALCCQPAPDPVVPSVSPCVAMSGCCYVQAASHCLGQSPQPVCGAAARASYPSCPQEAPSWCWAPCRSCSRSGLALGEAKFPSAGLVHALFGLFPTPRALDWPFLHPKLPIQSCLGLVCASSRSGWPKISSPTLWFALSCSPRPLMAWLLPQMSSPTLWFALSCSTKPQKACILPQMSSPTLWFAHSCSSKPQKACILPQMSSLTLWFALFCTPQPLIACILPQMGFLTLWFDLSYSPKPLMAWLLPQMISPTLWFALFCTPQPLIACILPQMSLPTLWFAPFCSPKLPKACILPHMSSPMLWFDLSCSSKPPKACMMA